MSNPAVTEESFMFMKEWCTPESTPTLWEVDYTKASYGWITADGTFYPCAFMEHDNLAKALKFERYSLRDFLGYGTPLKVHYQDFSAYPSQITDQQFAVLFELAKSQNELKDFAFYVRNRAKELHIGD